MEKNVWTPGLYIQAKTFIIEKTFPTFQAGSFSHYTCRCINVQRKGVIGRREGITLDSDLKRQSRRGSEGRRIDGNGVDFNCNKVVKVRRGALICDGLKG